MSRRLKYPIICASCMVTVIVACESNQATGPAAARQRAPAFSIAASAKKGQETQCDTILVTAPTVDISVGQVVQLTAQPFNSHGKPLADVAVAWSSFDPSVATVSSIGSVTGISTGSAIIRASCLATGAVGDILINVQ